LWSRILDSVEFASAVPLRPPVRRVRAGLALLLAMTAVVLFTNDSAREYLKVSIGDVHLVERDFFLYALLGLALLAAVITGRKAELGLFGKPVLAIAGVYYVDIIYGLWRGNDAKQIFFHIRQVNYLLIYFVFIYFVGSRRSLRLFLRMALACVLAAGAATVILALCFAQSDRVARNEFFWITGGDYGQYFHIRMAGAFFFGIALDLLLCLWVQKWPGLSRRRIAGMMILISLALALTVLRSYWCGLAASLLFLAALTARRLRFFLIGMFLILVVTGALFVAFADTDIGRFVQEQALAALDPDSMAVSDRILEHGIGVAAARERPWLGSGIGATIVIHMNSIGETIETSFCHDSFLTLFLFFGVFGCAIIGGAILLILRGARRIQREMVANGDRFGAALAIGCPAGIAGLLATSATAAAMNYSTGFFFIGIVLGILDRVSRLGPARKEIVGP
jgi:O-antigen ligase